MPTLTIRTVDEYWVLPESLEVIKLMIHTQQINPAKLRFNSDHERQQFIRKLSLLALKDECVHQSPSVIAELSRQLIHCNLH